MNMPRVIPQLDQKYFFGGAALIQFLEPYYRRYRSALQVRKDIAGFRRLSVRYGS